VIPIVLFGALLISKWSTSNDLGVQLKSLLCFQSAEFCASSFHRREDRHSISDGIEIDF
jgi:hypothetical protein